MRTPWFPIVLALSLLTGLASDADSARILSSTLFGSEGSDRIEDVARTADGGLIVVGTTTSQDFPTTPGALQEAPASDALVYNAFVAKLSPDLGGLEWSTYLGGGGTECLRRVALRPDGGIVVTGYTSSADFPTTAGALQESYGEGLLDVFVAELTPDGGALRFATYLGGSDREEPRDLVLASDGGVYLVGVTHSADFPITPGAYQDDGAVAGGSAFVARLSADGSRLVAATRLGGSFPSTGEALALGPDGSVHVAGTARSVDFPTTPGAYRESYSPAVEGNMDAFVSRLDADLTTLCQSTFLGERRYEGASIVVDAAGRAIVGGVGSRPGANDHHGFVARLTPDGSDLEWSTWFGSDAADHVLDLGLDANCNVYAVGTAHSQHYPFSSDAEGDLGLLTDQGALLAVFDPEGAVQHADLLTGGRNGEIAHAVHVDGDGRFVVAGSTSEAAFPVTPAALQPAYRGNEDAFVSLLEVSLAETDDGCGELEAPTCGDIVIPHGALLLERDRKHSVSNPNSLHDRRRTSRR